MCWVCNPFCGKCKPPLKIIKCSVCNANNLSNGEKCNKCGANLPELPEGPAVLCAYSGQICTNPCDKHKKAPIRGEPRPCRWNTPPKKKPEMT
ncbi:MAG: hypothetical protein H6Q74_63 [Firmicutes bacterium]|nr:hypothetical protein [Bacillota bacterium]